MSEALVESARELLQRYLAIDLLAELREWEAVRKSGVPPWYEAPRELNARTLITLDGIPGAGKSTTQRWLQPALGASYFSMARFAQAHGVTAEERMQHQRSTRTPHALDEAFLSTLAESDARFIVLEKFPRSVVEAHALLRVVRERGWRFELLHFRLPGDSVACSVQRQLDRGPRHGRMPAQAHAQHRALVHLARATSGRETLRAAGVPIHAFDTTSPPEEIARQVRRALQLDADSLSLHRRPLEVLERVAREVGVAEACVSSGSVYRAFWNGRFGPMQRPTDVDVAVDDERAVSPLLRALEREAPDERWSVLCPMTRLRERFGIETNSIAESKRFTTFSHRAGLLRLNEGRAELCFPDGVEACLRNGVVQLNASFLERLDERRRAEVIARHTHHLPRALKDYPGLRVADETARLLGATHRPRTVGSHWSTLKTLAVEAQREREREHAFCRRALNAEELVVAREILHFHRTSEHLPEPPLQPALAEPSADWRASDDARFGSWFLEQTHHHAPRGGADPYLRAVLDFSLFAAKLRVRHVEQSPMHQGWTLDRHLAQSVLELRTDTLLQRLAKTHDDAWLCDLRLAMRMAMLFHDTGKLLGPRPRRHACISARLFARFRPAWFPERLLELTQWLIRTHDLFGSFGRGLTDKQGTRPADYASVDLELSTSYFGAFDSQAVRAELLASGLPLDEATAINKAIWCADIGSIAALRWLLPVADLVERLVLVRGPRDLSRG
jgi:adenylate kinase family enzyme